MFKKKIIYILSATILVITILFANTNYIVEASSISPCAYYDPSEISFYGKSNSIVDYYDGNFMAIEAFATATDGVSRDVKISVYVNSTNKMRTYTIKTNGKTKKFDYIPSYSHTKFLFLLAQTPLILPFEHYIFLN